MSFEVVGSHFRCPTTRVAEWQLSNEEGFSLPHIWNNMKSLYQEYRLPAVKQFRQEFTPLDLFFKGTSLASYSRNY